MENEQKIIQWVQYDNKIKEYNEKCKKLREERDKIGSTVIEKFNTDDSLPTYHITGLNTSLSIQKINSYENYTNKFYKDCFTKFLGSEDKASELIEFMKKERKMESKLTLKRSYLMD
ncbi:MAG: hypothetical protein CMD29_03065 [Flavobacteriales bacterium]|nr:hypothetical protein [Flavobacteriales bacterium]